MRKIEEGMIQAIISIKSYSKDNTRVEVDENISGLMYVFLHDYMIATIDFSDNKNKIIYLRDGKYQTKTTKSRLNAILSHYNLPTIYSKTYQWFIGDEEWNGTKTLELEPPQKEFITVMEAWIK